jgi:tetratricopeptide (TPR) repeat protein/transcriptional regulator with XRE-family HTH domain
MPPRIPLARLLKSFRARSGLTQEALAVGSGLSVEGIRALEGGRRRHPRSATIDQLARALDLSPSERQQLETAASRNVVDHERTTVPRFPPPLDDFTGRTQELDELVRTLSRIGPGATSPSVMISAIGGMGGVGKTALALKAGHLVSNLYPDGQLSVDLGGGDNEPVATLDALATILRALDVPASGEPENLQLATARYRTALANRRLLLLLDDAISVDQVAPLIPGTAGSAVLITSRKQLAALPGVHYLGLQVMSEPDALQLLAEVVGSEQLAAEPDAARDVVHRCGLLPLAIRIAGAHPTSQIPGGLAILATLLADDTTRLDTLTPASSGGVRPSIRLSLEALAQSGSALDTVCVKAFPVLALFEGDHFPLRAASKVLQLSPDETEHLLERLVDVHLLETPTLHQYRMHDLVRDFGRELPAGAGAWERELDCYLAVLWRLSVLDGSRHPEYAAAWSVGAEDFVDREETARWLESELGNLLRLIRKAAAGGRTDRLTAARMALGMFQFAAVRMRFAEPLEALLTVVGKLGEPDNELDDRLWISLAQLHLALEQPRRAVACSRIALPLARGRGDLTQVVTCLIELAAGLVRMGEPAEALEPIGEALVLAPQQKRLHLEAAAQLVAGQVAGALGDLTGQRDSFGRATSVHLRRGSGQVPLLHQIQMAMSLVESRQYDAGWPMLIEALDRARAGNLPMIEFDVLSDLGTGWSMRGEHRRAHEYFEQALRIAVRFPAQNREAAARHRLGRSLAALGMPEEARAQWETAVVLYDRVADPAVEEVRVLLKGLTS